MKIKFQYILHIIFLNLNLKKIKPYISINEPCILIVTFLFMIYYDLIDIKAFKKKQYK